MKTMENFDLLHIFKPLFFWLRIVGLWPKDGSYGFDVYTFYSIICVLSFIFFNTFFQSMGLFMAQLDLNILAAALFVPAHIMATTKVYVFWNKLSIIKKLISAVGDPDFQHTSEHQIKFAAVDFKLWTILYRAYQIGITGVGTAVLLRPFMDGSYEIYTLPIFAWYPFRTTGIPCYQIAYVYQIIGVFYAVCAQLNIDGLSVGFSLYIATQCDLLCDKLRQVKNSIDLIKCIEHHRKILIFFTDFNHFLGYIIFGELFGGATLMALILFKLSLSIPGTTDFYALIISTFVVPLEIFFFCWFGNEIEVRSSNIPVAIFESNWIGKSAAFQKLLLIFAMRTQQPITLTAINLFPLSLRTFMVIMRTSWSYFTVLHQMKNK